MSLEKWKVEMVTHRGLVREVNEDAAAIINDALLLADGMGGYAAGEIASELFIRTASAALSPCPDDAKGERRLITAIEAANQAILSESAEHKDYSGMGTTALLMEHAGANVYWAQVGDSRIYRLRDGVLRRITQDHSLVADLVAEGSLTEAEARLHPKRNLLTRAVGVEAKVHPASGTLTARTGDMYLLCSDGLTNMVEDEVIQKVLVAQKESRAERLCQFALDAGGLDNITILVAEVNQSDAS